MGTLIPHTWPNNRGRRNLMITKRDNLFVNMFDQGHGDP